MNKISKIGFNARPFIQKSVRGLSRHTLELIQELHALDPRLEIYLYTYGEVDCYFKEQLPYVQWRETKIKPRILWDLFVLPSQIRKDKIQIFHSTNNLGLPWCSSVTKILTIHDALTHQYRINNDLKYLFGRFLYVIEYYLLKKADRFITISNAAKNEICQKMQIPNEKLRVIYNGANALASNNNQVVREDYYLYVGGLEERKNIPYMLKAFENAQLKVGKVLKLVLVSKMSSANEEVRELIKKSICKIVVREDVSDEELGKLYQKSKALINPSLIEGFGLPLIEAMRTNTPVIAADIEVFKEITEGKAYFFNPMDTENLSTQLESIENGKLDINRFISSAHECSEKYLWSTMAKETFKLYEEALNN